MVLQTTSRTQGGRFRTARAQRGHSTTYYGVHPGNTPAPPPPTEACMIHSKPHRGCRLQGPGTRGYRGWETAGFSHSAGTGRAQRTVRPQGSELSGATMIPQMTVAADLIGPSNYDICLGNRHSRRLEERECTTSTEGRTAPGKPRHRSR